MGGITGLNYSAVVAVIKLLSKKHRKRLFKDICAIERGFLREINRER